MGLVYLIKLLYHALRNVKLLLKHEADFLDSLYRLAQ